MKSGPHRLRDVWDSERAFDRLLGLENEHVMTASEQRRLEMRVMASFPQRNWNVAAFIPHMPARVSAQQWLTGGALAACLAFGVFMGAMTGGVSPNDEYADMLSLSGAGAGAMFLSVLDEHVVDAE
ncbi:MAG: hypothetical protein R3C52_05135 [Hyphomonadaceae bacterium]